MKKILALAIATLLLFMAGCSVNDGQAPIIGEKYLLKAILKSVNDNQLEVEVIESDYAFGIYWVHVSDAKYVDADGNSITKSDLKVGDTIKITYGGQVMMSSPPQIVASQIQKI
jgi:hypothetical protein